MRQPFKVLPSAVIGLFLTALIGLFSTALIGFFSQISALVSTRQI